MLLFVRTHTRVPGTRPALRGGGGVRARALLTAHLYVRLCVVLFVERFDHYQKMRHVGLH